MMIDPEKWAPRLAAVAEATPADSAHGMAHVRRVVALALSFATRERAEVAVVLPAAYLHDCVSLPKDSPDRSRASSLAAARAVERLAEIGYPAIHLEAVKHCIEAHSFSAGIFPRTLEAKVVQDADRLDALGAIGIARCFAVGGTLGREIYSDEDPFCQSRDPDDHRFTLDHFYAKLLRLPDTMRTVAGREEARHRVEFMRGFLDQLRREIFPGHDAPAEP